MQSLAFSEPRPNHEIVRCGTNRLKFNLTADHPMIASQPSFDNNTSGIVSVREGNFVPTSSEKNMFVTCSPFDTAVSYRHRVREQSHGFNIAAGVHPSRFCTGSLSRSCTNVSWDSGCCHEHGSWREHHSWAVARESAGQRRELVHIVKYVEVKSPYISFYHCAEQTKHTGLADAPPFFGVRRHLKITEKCAERASNMLFLLNCVVAPNKELSSRIACTNIRTHCPRRARRAHPIHFSDRQ